MSCPEGALVGLACHQKSSLETVYEHIGHHVNTVLCYRCSYEMSQIASSMTVVTMATQ
jgi:hypothetical protein